MKHLLKHLLYMSPQFMRSVAGGFTARFALFAALLGAASASAATIVWNGPATTNTANNWSSSGNWLGGVAPAATDDVKFFDLGAVPGTIPNITNINNTVDVNTTNGWLLYGNTNGFHTTLVADGVTLTINSNLDVGTLFTSAAARTPYASITGAGGTVIVNSTNSYLAAKQGGVTGGRATLDMTGLGNFQATVKSVHIGTTGISPNQAPGTTTFETGTILLGRTNVITAVFTPANLNFIGGAAAIELGYNGSSSAGGANFLYLGLTNSINVTSIRVGGTKGTAATMAFNPAFTNQNPVAVFRGPNGGSTRVSYWSAGDMGERGSGSGVVPGTNDFTFGTVDAMVDAMILGQDPVGTDATVISTTSQSTGVLKFNAGIIDVNTLIVGNQQTTNTHAPSSAPFVGKVFINGNATLKVNTVLKIGSTTSNTPSGLATFGQLNVTNGTVLANSITVGSNTVSANNVISLTSATLIVSNALASSVTPLTNYYTANSLLGLTLTSDGSTKAFFGILTTGGSTNVVQINATPVFFGSYPAQIALIKYSSLTGSGYNFGLTNLPNWAPDAYLSNNVANKSVDLVLPSDPRPSTTAPSSYSGNPGDNVTFSVTAGGVTPLSYQWRKDGVSITDGATGNGSTNFGVTTATLGITNAQPADSASASGYTVVITNLYGSITSSPAVLTISASAVAPSITGPNNQTVIQGNTATFTASVAGNPVPAVQWQTGGTNIPGATSTTLVVNSVQYPANDQQVYSIIATNTAGSVTNSATLTVIVPPFITAQPVSLVVTNTQAASFTVAATGVPAPAYQWKKNGTPISAGVNSTATNATFTIASVSSSDIATYSVTITNQAGTTNSASVTLIVNSLMATTSLSPTNGATGVCYDTPLALTFSAAPSLGAAGKIKIYNVTNSTTPVDTIDVATGAAQQRAFPGDGQSFTYQTLKISGSTATIYPHFSVMTSNATYYVTIDNGAFTDATGAYFVGITATNVWQFATKTGGPADTNNPVVNADGSADFVTVQGAVNSLATGTNATQRVVSIRNGLYNEIVDIAGKHNVTLRGQSRAGAVIYFPNNANFQTANAGTTHARMTFKVNANDVVLDTLTVSNSTPQGGSQAEALMIESNAKRCIVFNAELDSRQDTILGNQNSSQTYFLKTIVKGNFDYIWGGGNFYFDQCAIQTIAGTGSGQLTAARTDTAGAQSVNFPWLNPSGGYTANGMSFVNCTFTADAGLGPITLAGSNGTANNNVSWVGCDFATNYVAPSASLFSGAYVFWQNSNTTNGSPVTFAVLTTISGADPRLLAATNIPTWFYGWSPAFAPYILTQPANQSVAGGQSANFNVVAAGISDPTYQWLKNGTPLGGQTSATLTINNANANAVASYSVIVSNAAGTVTSSSATLTVGNNAPTLTPVSGATVNVGVTVNNTSLAADLDTPAQSLTFSLLTGPGSVGAGSGVFTWRPQVTDSDTTNVIKVVVTDNGTPNLRATNTFTVIVNPLTQSNAGAPVYAGGQFSLTVTGQVGPDYALQVSTDLASGVWTTLLTTNSPPSPFTFSDTNAGTLPAQFYRIKVGPPLP